MDFSTSSPDRSNHPHDHHQRTAFEANIQTHLVDHGWSTLVPSGHYRKAGVSDEVIEFAQASQPKEWQSW